MSRAEKDASVSETDGTLERDLELGNMDPKEEVHRLARELGISIEEAERSVLGFDVGGPVPETRVLRDLGEVEEGMTGITVRARLITLHQGTRKDGEGEYYYGMLGDSRTTVKFSAWTVFDYSPGDFLLLQNVSARRFRDSLEIVINKGSRITSTQDREGLVPEMEEGIPQTIAELESGARKVDIEARVIEIRSSELKVKDRSRKIMKGVLADSTGRMDFTCWDPLPLEEGRCYRLTGGYVKDFRGILKLNLDGGTIVRGLADDRLPPLEELMAPKDARILELLEGRLSGPVRIRGTVLGVPSGSGLFRRCVECGRRLVKGQCTVHGRVKGEEDLAVRAVFDDGSGTLMLKGGRTLVESLLGRTMEEISEEVRSSMEPEIIVDELSSKMVGRTWTVSGDPLPDDYGVTLSVTGMTGGIDQEVLKKEISLLLEVMS
ncbi:MAG TPA: hypothetical protein ENK47_08175 [Euryarchaeota archaeon]|nr:MAG: hypothetical protein B6U90_03625 [Thermoplasmatales archaeon ex4484_6]RLF69509.1 MAG: hypothetical protein DRN57_00585 [Thermoplasmata archaeon]HHD16669.1 hypothetical protein [Euryarchaeota archaeon]